jgi:hypothetical protein
MSDYEAIEAVEHHRHHPADPNAGVVRAPLTRQAILAAVISGAITIAAVVALAIAIGNGS